MVQSTAQDGEAVCRYHEFIERGRPFTRGYDAAGAGLTALPTESGRIVAAAAVVFPGLGFVGLGFARKS